MTQKQSHHPKQLRTGRSQNSLVYILCTTGICIAIVMIFQISESSVYFFTPSEAQQRAATLHEQTIRVGGMVKAQSLNLNAQELKAHFILTDYQSTSLNVSYKGLLPDMFTEDGGVVVEGRITPDGSSMVAYKLMVKHSEEYQIPEDLHSISPELLQKSLFKNETSSYNP